MHLWWKYQIDLANHVYYLCQELSNTLLGTFRHQLHCHTSTIFQQAIVDISEASLAELPLEVVRHGLHFAVREPPVFHVQAVAWLQAALY